MRSVGKKLYQWQRYWRPRGSPLLFFENGFLFSPGKINPNVLPFEKIADALCLALLGEPGMGKSHAMKAEYSAFRENVTQQGDEVLWLDLRSYGSEDRLVNDLFRHQIFQSWLTGAYKLHLFLDSFDECQIAIRQLASLLADELEKYKPQCERLTLRIACRTADWPNLLENRLTELWGNDSVKAYELAPLTEDDVRAAAIDENIDPDRFLSEIRRREVGPLAAKPVTLRLLLNLFRNGGALPTSQTELYARGCLTLAGETNESYITAGRTGRPDAAQRMAVAARIAAITIFSQKSAIWTATDLGEPTVDDVKVADLCGGVEMVNNASFEVDAAAIEETINTGLFDSRGENRMGWAHQTYAEFLAAWYLAKLQTPTEQVLKLLVHPEDPEGKLVPQLHETAAWSASLMPDLFREIMRREPKVLLQSDVASTAAESKAALVEELLKLYDEELDFDTDWFRPSRYHKLKHPTIANQIRPFIVNPEKKPLVRLAAIEMAEECETTPLQNDLADLALDVSQRLDIRAYAARAVANIGNAETKLRLRPLITSEVGDDPDRRLQRHALSALWPDHLSTEDVFSLLTTSRLNKHFISQDLIEGLKLSDLPIALAWVERQPGYNYLDYYEQTLANKLMLLAWENLEAPGVLKAFARAALSRLRKLDDIVDKRHSGLDDFFSDDPHPRPKFSEQWAADDRKRRLALETISSLISTDDLSDQYLFSYRLQSTWGKDVLWVLERLESEESEDKQRVWARLIKAACDWKDREQMVAIVTRCQHNQILFQEFYPELTALLRNLTEAGETTTSEATEQELDETSKAQPMPSPTPTEIMSSLLAEIEAGDSEAWVKLVWVMRFEEDGAEGVDEFKPDLKTYPSWRRADDPIPTRKRILAAARRYLLEQDAQTSKWLGSKPLLLWRPAYAGYNALRLVYDEDKAFFLNLDSQVWKKWASIIAAYRMFGDVKAEERAIHETMVQMAYRHAADEVISTVLTDLDRESDYVISAIKVCWDERLGEALLNKAKELQAMRRSFTAILDELLARNTEGARDFAESVLKLPLPTEYWERRQIIITADLLMQHSQDAAWSIVWPLIQNDEEFGRELIVEQSGFARRPGDHNPPIPKRLNESQLADLYIWMLRQYPPSEDPDMNGFSFGTDRRMIVQWRDSILTHLKSRGTEAACDAIERVGDEFPDLTWVRAQLLEAKAIYRQRSWQPPQPAEILKLAGEQRRYLIQTTAAYDTERIFRGIWVLECEETSSQGTAFMLAGVGLVTCRHALGSKTQAFHRDDYSKKYPVKILAEDETLDLAILSIDAPASEELVARYSPELIQGEQIAVAGFPHYNWGDTGTLFPGVVGGFHQYHSIRRPLISAPIIQGVSGGPILDSKGQVVGVAVKGAKHTDETNLTEHIVIPINALRHLEIEGRPEAAQ